jgi:L-methionine (R)-S-oxide reductase
MLDVGTLITDLSRLQDGGYLSDAMLRHAVKTIERADPRFDWVGVYLLDPEKNELWLHNYVGSPTEHARIPVGTGVCGRAVAEETNLRIDDVSKEENYLACSPSVESELVVLIRDGSRIFGQIDIDSSDEAAFNEEDELALQAIADKLAEQLAIEKG